LRGPDDVSLLVVPLVWDTEEDAREFYNAFLEFTEARTGEKWEAPAGEDTDRTMKLPGQVISIDLEMMKTLVIFAPGVEVQQKVTHAIDEANDGR
jgi:hypothetical protein